MNQTVTLLLFFLGDATADEARALGRLAAREKVSFVKPVPGPPSRTPPYAEELVLRIEASLDEAQTLAASLDETRALAILAEVERELDAHPELPQAAWLLAERHRLAAAVRRSQPDGAPEADALERAAAALEGDRAAAFGAAPIRMTPERDVLLTIHDLDVADSLYLDGLPAAASERVSSGSHQVRVLRHSSLVWAGWIDVPAEPSVVRELGVPPRVPCSEDDLAAVSSGILGPTATPGVRCERWMGVRRTRSGLEVARCRRHRCSAFVALPSERPPREPATLSSWAAVAIVGAATLGAGSLLIFTGAFERDPPPRRTVVVYEGPR